MEKKTINRKDYYYLRHSFRVDGKSKTKTLAYIGEKKDEEKIRKLKKKFTKEKLDKIKKEVFEEKGWNKELLFDKEKLEQIRKEFSIKLKKLDDKTKKDMFEDFLTYFVFNTNAIEGNTFTLRDTDLLLNKGITPQGKSLREVNDHLNSRDVFHYLQKKNPAINNKMIALVHSMLVKNTDERVGYRRHNVRVVGATFKSTSFEYVQADMNLLLRWYNKNKSKLHPLILASLFHHKFEKIHPFYDGNGRTGRMLMNLILMNNKFPPIVLSNKQRKIYYEVLSKADKVNLTEISEDYRPLAKFISTQLLKTWNTIFREWGL